MSFYFFTLYRTIEYLYTYSMMQRSYSFHFDTMYDLDTIIAVSKSIRSNIQCGGITSMPSDIWQAAHVCIIIN